MNDLARKLHEERKRDRLAARCSTLPHIRQPWTRSWGRDSAGFSSVGVEQAPQFTYCGEPLSDRDFGYSDLVRSRRIMKTKAAKIILVTKPTGENYEVCAECYSILTDTLSNAHQGRS